MSKPTPTLSRRGASTRLIDATTDPKGVTASGNPLLSYGGTLEGRGPDGKIVPTTTEPEDLDAAMGLQLSMQFDKCVNNRRDDILLGAMGLKLRDRIATGSARGATKASHDPTKKGTGIKGWLATYAPKVSESILYRCIEIAEGVQEICKLGKKVDLEELLAGSVEDLPDTLRKKREEIEKLIEGKSQRQLLLEFGDGEGKSRGGKTYDRENGKGARKPLTAAEQAALHREAVLTAAKSLRYIHDHHAYAFCEDDAELDGLIDHLSTVLEKARAWRKLNGTQRKQALAELLPEDGN